MAIADQTIEPKILASARKEFIKNGYYHSSLKKICTKADVTTGALYKRFSGKGELFEAVVAPTLREFEQKIEEKSEDPELLTNEQLLNSWKMTEESMFWWGKFFYQHQDIFNLLLTKSQGSPHENFDLEIVEKMLPKYCAAYQECFVRKMTTLVIDEREMRVLVATFWTTILKPIVYQFDWTQLASHYQIVCRLFNWQEALKIKV